MEVSNLKVISKEVLKAVDAASEEVMQIYKSDSYEIEGKIDGSPVTLADKRSHDVLSSSLASELLRRLPVRLPLEPWSWSFW